MDYQIVTVSNTWPTQWYYLHKQFFASLKQHPVTLINYSSEEVSWNGLTTKPKWLYRAIKEGGIKSKYVIFADCWDLVFSTEPEEIMDIFNCFRADIVISAESNCFPSDLKNEFDKISENYSFFTPYKYLNSGFIVGNTDAILTCLESMDLPNMRDDYYDEEKSCAVHGNDQFEWQKIFIKQPVNIELDVLQLLSQTLHNAALEDFDFSKERIKNVITGSYPCTWHFNGGGKTGVVREPILKHLNLI